MWYEDKANFEGLRAIAASIADQPDMQLFAQYCQYREQGLRKHALHVLPQFIEQVGRWPFAHRQRFVDWLLTIHGQHPDIHQLLPHPLMAQVVHPTLVEWTQRDPQDSVPLRWRGIFFDEPPLLEQAIILNPHDVLARIALIEWLIGKIDHATHHLPDYFIGEPPACLQWATLARRLLEPVQQHPEHDRLHHELDEVEALVTDWMTFLTTGADDFAGWCQHHGRTYAWTTTY
jgi:hypothetical protein